MNIKSFNEHNKNIFLSYTRKEADKCIGILLKIIIGHRKVHKL